MVYDPIRDCEVPSPAGTTAPGSASGWREGRTPGSEGGENYHYQQQGYPPPPPAFTPGQRSPGTHRSLSGGLRGLLNEDDSRRSSDQRSSISSTATGQYDDHPSNTPSGPRPSIHQLLNTTPAPPLSKTTSSSSATHSSSPSNASPGQPYINLDPAAFLTPAQPAAGRHRSSRSPYPLYDNASPGPGQLLYSNDYPAEMGQASYKESMRRASGGQSQKPMLPPQEIPQHYDYRNTPTASHLPLRSPSVSVSPRTHQASLPPNHPSSRPTSSSASNPFAFQTAPSLSMSPSRVERPLSGSLSRQASEDLTNDRRSAAPSRRGSQVLTYSPSVRHTPSPVNQIPYNPNRISRPGSVLLPIRPDELADYKAIGFNNNPLRKRKKKPLPSWSGPPSSSRLPNENDTSYFPAEDAPRQGASVHSRRASNSSAGRMSSTPGPRQDRTASGTPVDQRAPPSTNGKRHASTSRENNNLKRSHEAELEPGHDMTRRKVSGGAYVGNAGHVADHYNSRPEVGVEHRELSPIIGLKKFNNWIKSVLIGKFAFRGHNRPGANVLDLGCGKGGDLNKWKQARIRLYVGMDIAGTSIDQARERYQKMYRPGFDGHFFAFDCFSNPLNQILPQQLSVNNLYDNVTLQFCMHYAFETASKARMMMENVSRYLRPGGTFIGTIPDSQLLLDKLAEIPEDSPELMFGNDCYRVVFSERHHKGTYGHQYRFFLEDAVGDVPEYIVDWENFVALAGEYGLSLSYRKTFNEVLQEEQSSRDFGPLLSRMGVVDENGQSAMDANQWEAANLYMAFAFVKR